MNLQPKRFIGEQIEVEFDRPPEFAKRPHCPDRFSWLGHSYTVTELLSAWVDFGRRGRMAVNMRPEHAATASSRGSWGVGRYYFRVRTQGDRVFDLYYDRAPGKGDGRKGAWFLLRELAEAE